MNGVSKVSSLTQLAGVAFGVEQALQTFAAVRVAVARLGYIHIVITRTRFTRTSGDLGVSVVVFIAHVTPRTFFFF